MSVVIVIEIIVGVVVLAAAVRFAVRDTRQRESAQEPEVESAETTQTPPHSNEPEPQPEVAQPLSEVGSTEKS